MSIPKEVIDICWQYGLHGRIYIPSPNKTSKLEQLTRAVLEEMECVYEEMGTTFVREKSKRRVFSRFTIEQVRKRHEIAYETARKATKRSRQRWAFWFQHHEAGIFDRLEGTDRFLYLRIRGMLRGGRKAEEIRRLYPGMDAAGLIETATESIRSCPWRIADANP